MSDSWKEDDCTAITALYSVYSVPQAAALWCGVNEKELQQVLSEVSSTPKKIKSPALIRGAFFEFIF
jgi:hypothetical protein